MHDLKEFFQRLKYPFIILIFLLIIESYIFYSISYNFAIVLILIVFLLILPKINNKIINITLIIIQFIFLLVIAYFYNTIYVVNIIIPILHALLYYYKSNKKYNYQIILFIFTISLIITSFILLILWIISSFLIKNFLIFSIFILVLTTILFVFLYIAITIYLSKLIKIYDFETYFKFKKFKFLNIITSTNTNKSITKLLIIIGIICFIVFIIFQIYFFSLMKDNYSTFEKMEIKKEEYVKDIWFNENYELFRQNLEDKGFYNISEYINDFSLITREEREEYYRYIRKYYNLLDYLKENYFLLTQYGKIDLNFNHKFRFKEYKTKYYINNSINYYYQNCNHDFNCEIIENNKNISFENYYDHNNRYLNRFITAYKNNNKILLKIPDEKFIFENERKKVISNIPNVSFYNYSKTNGIEYINNKYRITIFNYLNSSLPKFTYYNYIKNNGLPLEDIEFLFLNEINFIKAKFMDVLGYQIYTSEVYWIEKNKKGFLFYNNATNLQEHIIKLNESISKLEKIYKEFNKTNNTWSEFEECKSTINNNSIFNRSVNRFFNNEVLFFGKKDCLVLTKIIILTSNGFESLYDEIIDFLKNNLNNQTEINKALDMKMIEYIFAKKITDNYENCFEDCEKKILEITKNPNFCWFGYDNRDECFVKYPYDKRLCEYIEDFELKEKCLSNFKN
jgi:hypothetical protein